MSVQEVAVISGCVAVVLPSSAVALDVGSDEPQPAAGDPAPQEARPVQTTEAPPAPSPAPSPPADQVQPTAEEASAARPAADDAPAERSSDKRTPRSRARKTARAAADGSVRIVDFRFSPSTVSVNVGDTVTWTNRDSEPHTATANNDSFDTGTLNRGESGSATFRRAGSIAYICTIHPSMKGTVRVASTGSGGGSASGDAGDSGGSGGSGDASGSDGGDPGSDGSDGSLPATGADPDLLLAIGLAMLAAGLGLMRRLRIGS